MAASNFARNQTPNRRLLRRCWRPILVIGLLVLHFATRYRHVEVTPLNTRHDYGMSYGVSLSLLHGRGFEPVALGDTPASAAVGEFLRQERSRLTTAEARRFFAQPATTDVSIEHTMHRVFSTTRVLDIYLAAGLWSLFGVNWHALFVFYCLASALTCLMVFLMARRLGGGFGPGWLAALLFFASPLETYFIGWSIRDSSPMWFAAAALCVLVCLVDRFASRTANAVAVFGAGALATLGLGWRFDAMLLVPFAIGALGLHLCCQRASVRRFASTLTCFALGAAMAYAGIAALTPRGRQSLGTGFHIAYYGEFVRCNLLGLENSFQVHWCDAQTAVEARRLDDLQRQPKQLLKTLSPEYGRVCRQMYWEVARYNAFRWVSGFPEVCWSALAGLPGDAAALQGLDAPQAELVGAGRFDFAQPCYVWILDPLTSAAPWLCCIGLAVAAVYGRERRWALVLLAFAVYFIAVLFAVLPMRKNMAMLLPPLYVFAGLGLWTVLRLFRRATWLQISTRLNSINTRRALWAGAGCVAVWGLACLATWPLSRSQRQLYLDEVARRAAGGSGSAVVARQATVFCQSSARVCAR